MKRLLAVPAALSAALIFATTASAWVHPTPKTITCDNAVFVVPKGAHETTPWLANVYVNNVNAVADSKVFDTATGYAPGTITIPLAAIRPLYDTSHVKVTVNGPGGYSDGGSTVEADLQCDTRPVPSPPPAPPVTTPPVVATPPATLPGPPVPRVAKPPVVRKCKHIVRNGKRYIVCMKPPHKCSGIRLHKTVKHGPHKGQHYTVCYHPPKRKIPHFAG